MYQCHDTYPAEGYERSEPRTVQGAACHDTYDYGDWCPEMVLVDAVRDWVERVAPGDEATAKAAVSAAVYFFAEGASVSEACEAARSRALCRLRHPSHARSAPRYAAAS